MMAFPYKKVLVIGATSGIGLALAEKLVSEGIYVIATGRRQENLDAFVKKHGSSKVSAIRFDITDLDSIPSFAQEVLTAHPTLDALLLSAGLQRTLNFLAPSSISLPTLTAELTTNYTAQLHLTLAFLPHLFSLSPSPAALIYISSGLALVPNPRCANYCATKAALHTLVLGLRAQLRTKSDNNVRIVEIIPQATETELHNAKNQPETGAGTVAAGQRDAMPLGVFLDIAWKGLEEGKETIAVGSVERSMREFEERRVEIMEERIRTRESGGRA